MTNYHIHGTIGRGAWQVFLYPDDHIRRSAYIFGNGTEYTLPALGVGRDGVEVVERMLEAVKMVEGVLAPPPPNQTG